MKKKLSIVLAVVLTLTLLLTSTTFAGGGKKEVVPAQMVLDASLSEVSTVFDIPKADLEVATSRGFSFGADKFLLSSIVDKKNKQAYMVSTDAQGKVWIAEPKIEGELIDHMSQMKPEETVTVSIWAIYVSPEEELGQIPFKYPGVTFEGDYPALGADVSPEVLDAIEADVTEIKLRANEEAVQPVVDFLQSTGSTILYVSKLAPIVCAELSTEGICKLARLPEVESISWPNEELEPCLDTAAPTINADDVWAKGYDGGMSDGSGSPTNYQTRVAIVDTGINSNHPALHDAHLDTIPGGVADDHGTEVAGCIASIDETYRGIAYGTQFVDADYGDGFEDEWDNVIDACDWVDKNFNVDLYNFSSGWLTNGQWNNDQCQYFDHIADVWNRLPVVAAGNDGQENGWVRSPGNAWNVLTVGGIDDNDTEDWSDDTLYNSSSWRNPNTTHDDREKPEVCAPAVDIITTDIEGGFTDDNPVSGTSFAAPQVTGIAALLIEKNHNLLQNNPALLKAIIMASAIHNVEPDDDYVQWGYGQPYFPNGLEKYRPMDDKEGVGTVNAEAAYKCVATNDHPGPLGVGWIWSGQKQENQLPFDIPFYAAKGEKVRFVITWYAHTNFEGTSYYGNGLCADMNLEIIGGMFYPWWPTWYCGSNSYDSAWEIVQFTAPRTGNYYARVTATDRGAGDPWPYNGAEHIAAAWYRWNDDDFEWGSDEDSLSTDGSDIGWGLLIDEVDPFLGSLMLAEIDTGQACSGTRSARFYRPPSNPDFGGSIYAIYPKFQPDSISFCFRKEGDSCADIMIGDGEHRIRVRINSEEKIQYYDNTGWHDTGRKISVNSWYLIELRNINWSAGTYDMCIDRYKFKSGVPMQTYQWYSGYIMYGSELGSGNFWIDNVS